MSKPNLAPASLLGRSIASIRVHVPLFIEGFGSINAANGAVTKDSIMGKLGALSMLRVEGGVLLKAGNREGFVPDSNIVALAFSPAEAPVKLVPSGAV